MRIQIGFEEGRARLESAYGRLSQRSAHLLDDLGHLQHLAKEQLHPERLRDGTLAVLGSAFRAGGDLLQSWSRWANEAVVYEAGETASAGTLTCLNCGRVIHLAKTSPVPLCPDCLATRFRKTF
jgi:hypothetical protein